MEPLIRLDIFSILLFISIGQIFISILFLMSQIRRNKSALLLAIILLIFGLNILEPVFIRTRFLYNTPHLLYIGPFFLLLLGPAFYMYVLSVKHRRFKWKPISLLHLVPFVIITLFRSPNVLQSASDKRAIINKFFDYETTEAVANPSFTIISVLMQMHPLVYFIIALIVVFLNMKKLNCRFTKFHLTFLTSLSVVFSFCLFGRYIMRVLNINSTDSYWEILSIILFVFVCYSSFLIIKNLLKPKNQQKALKSDVQANDLYKNLKNFMEFNQPYLDTDISLASLANGLNISTKLLSKIINEFEKMNFSEFINSYRIEKAKDLILDKDMEQYTLEAIGKEVGFSNKMSFNRAFKRHLKMTPSQYKTLKSK